jgi:mono/diheme cytochrome c family protein
MKRMAAGLSVTLAVGLVVAVVGCDNMANQPKRLPFELPYGAKANGPMLPPKGVVARDEAFGPPAPPPVTLALLERGQQRFDIDCAPCHGRAGEGDGMVVQRGFPHPPSYFSDKLRQAPIQHFYDVITNGYGVMFPYADRVAPADRWAIVAYIRALQASSSAQLADVPPDQRRALQ